MNEKVLIIEDEKDVCEVLQETLEYDGYAVKIAHTGDEAIKALDADDYEVMLVDMRLEGQISGLDLIRQCREREKCPKILVVSATPKSELFSLFDEEGLTGCVEKFLEKPTDLQPDIITKHLEILVRNK